MTKILLVEDDQAFRETLELELRSRKWEVVGVDSAAIALERLRTEEFGVVVTDVRVKGPVTGFDLCARVAAAWPDVPVIVITGFGSLDSAVEAIRAGAYDFIAKPFETDALVIALDRAGAHRSLKQEVLRLRRVHAERPGDDGLLGQSRSMARVRDLLARLEGSDATVLVTGESGTGKEVVAHALHRSSRRAQKPFVAINCAAMPENLLESELFGHARGAFTDAKGERTGLFQKAEGGTLFLDEIGDMPLALQPKLLRALQERRVRPVGSDTEIAIDVRVVAATNRDLESAIEDRTFREDLYFRLNVVQIELPPLRSREGDVLLLAQAFIEECAARVGKRVIGLSADAARRLSAYPFPGNVRELQNAIERAVALTRYAEITSEDLPDRVAGFEPRHVLVTSDDPDDLVPLEEVERRYITRVLEACGGHRTRAAKLLGLDRKTLYRKLLRFKLVKEGDDGET